MSSLKRLPPPKNVRVCLRVEALEGRETPAAFFVNTTGDTHDVANGLDANGNISLRSAIEEGNATGGATISFDATVFAEVHVVTLTIGELQLQANFTINGTTPTNISVIPAYDIDNPPTWRIMEVFAGTTSTLNNMTLSNATQPNADGGGIWNKGDLTLSNSEVSNCTATNGGGIFNNYRLTVRNSSIHNNTAVLIGGGIATAALATSVTDIWSTPISQNTANKGGGIAVLAGASLTIHGASIDHNTGTANGAGGGLYVSGGTAALTGCNIIGNTGWEGAGLENSSGTVTLTALQLKDNTANTWGGAILAKGGTTTLDTVTVGTNYAGNGGPQIAYTLASTTINLISCTGITESDIVQVS